MTCPNVVYQSIYKRKYRSGSFEEKLNVAVTNIWYVSILCQAKSWNFWVMKNEFENNKNDLYCQIIARNVNPLG